VCKDDTSVTVSKSEQHQQSVITTIASSNKMLANSLNKLSDKGMLFNYFFFYRVISLYFLNYIFFSDRAK